MKEIDLNAWPRRHHYAFFRAFENPFYDVAARVNLTPLVDLARSEGRGLFAPMMHLILRAANATQALRLRFQNDRLFEVDHLDASFTLMGDNGIFNYATARFDPDLDIFSDRISQAVEHTRARTDVNLDHDYDLPLVFITSMPWLDFQSISHALSGDPNDCFPRIAWGKITNHGTDLKPRFETTVQLTSHHALVDGRHAAQFFENLEDLLLRL